MGTRIDRTSELVALEHRYNDAFFKRRCGVAPRVPYVVKAIQEMFDPKSVVDVGCATGDIVKGLLDVGIDAWGIEGSSAVIPYLVAPPDAVDIMDLREPLEVCLKYDLAYCIEVAEHIEPEYADIFVNNLCGLSGRVLLSAAPPGQKGKGHVNCQPHEYWIEKMATRGYSNYPEITKAFWSYIRPCGGRKAIRWFFQRNLMYFEATNGA